MHLREDGIPWRASTLLDRLIGSDYPDLPTDAEVRAFEQVPYAERIAAREHL